MRRLGVFLVFASVFIAAMWATASAFDTARENQTTYRYIADALQHAQQSPLTVSWLPPSRPLARPMNAADEALIGRALTEAWQSLATAQATGNADLLEMRFSGPAHERATLSVLDAQIHGASMAPMMQEATPGFYHLDGSVFQTRIKMLTARMLPQSDGNHITDIAWDTVEAIMLNEAKGWRMYSYKRIGVEPVVAQSAAAPLDVANPYNGINYYPSKTPWRDFWDAFDPAVIGADFDKISALGATTIRVFLPTADFTTLYPDETLGKLETLLALAQERGLHVVPTLFDLKADYREGGWAVDGLYLQRVIPVLAQSSATLFVDLKNEPDLDFEAHGEARVTSWLTVMATAIRQLAPDVRLTIGWSAARFAPVLEPMLDVITYHDYEPQEGTEERLATVRAAANGKPVLVTEIGATSFSLIAGLPGSPEKQAEAIAARLEALSKADGVFLWTLHDFPKVDPSVVGSSPLVKLMQARFGIYDVDGNRKPLAAVVEQAWR